jgi:peptidoglycan-associated lipoprotein
MRLKTLSTLLLAAVVAIVAAGCKKKMDRVTPLPGYGAGPTIRDPNAIPRELGAGMARTGPDTTGNTSTGPTPGPDGKIALTGARDIEGRPQDREKYRGQTVYFDFDRASVKASDAAKVQEVASRFKNEDPSTDLLIEGHCDERGTEEYNRSLGERRALALRELLVAAGISADRIHTVSFGKDKPAEEGHNEGAWSKNRRGEFILVLPK